MPSGLNGRSLAAQIPETLSEDILAKMHAAPKPDVPLADVHELPNYDGMIIAFPTRCADVPAATSFLPARTLSTSAISMLDTVLVSCEECSRNKGSGHGSSILAAQLVDPAQQLSLM